MKTIGVATILLSLLAASPTAAQDAPPPGVRLPAFPGAEGFGAYTPGGRGGRVLFVTSLADSGPGTLRAACEAEGPRTVVFRTGGTIHLRNKLNIREPYLTIAGQTAPGGGIGVRGWPIVIGTHDVVVRSLRVRTGDETEKLSPTAADALQIGMRDRDVHDVIIDHCSFSWATDENVSTWFSGRDITIQWCVISEALRNSRHGKGVHSMGLLVGDHTHRLSIHHNLMASNNYRNPQPKGDTSTEIVNNVVYNWGSSAIPFSDPEGSGPSQAHIIGNVFLAGPDTREGPGCVQLNKSTSAATRVYVRDNLADPEWPMVTPDTERVRAQLADAPLLPDSGLRIDAVAGVREAVLLGAGAIRPTRDAVDARIVEGVRGRTGRIIDSQREVGGWPELAPGTAPADADEDGMPDDWEARFGLDPRRGDDAADRDADGYTNLEECLNHTDPTRPGD